MESMLTVTSPARFNLRCYQLSTPSSSAPALHAVTTIRKRIAALMSHLMSSRPLTNSRLGAHKRKFVPEPYPVRNETRPKFH